MTYNNVLINIKVIRKSEYVLINIKCYHWNSPSGPPGLWKYNSQYGFINYGGSVGYCEMVSIWDAYQRFLIIPTKKTIWIWKCKKTDTNVNSKKSWIKAQNSEQFLVLAVIQICWSQICWTAVLDANQRTRKTGKPTILNNKISRACSGLHRGKIAVWIGTDSRGA